MSKQQVWVLNINHKHGNDISVHSTEEKMKDVLYNYVVQYWSDWMEDSDGKPIDIDKYKRDEAIERYFDFLNEQIFSEEWYEANSHQID